MTFAEKVFRVVSKIPRGRVMTYKQVAKAAGRLRAWRAVGNILHRNPHPASGHPLPQGEGIVIPCHRVVKSDGGIGGYVGRTRKKIMLLRKEGVMIKGSRVNLTEFLISNF